MDFKKIIKKKSIFDYLTYVLVIALGIAVDQVTKALAIAYLEPVGSVPIIEDVLHLTFVMNPGMAWGLFGNATVALVVIRFVMTIGLSAYLALGHAQNKLYGAAFSLIIAGGVGNIIDFFLHGEVVDFIDFTLINFPVFNGADSFVVIGAFMLIVLLVIDIVKEARAKKNEDGEK